jgi:drug/metabolite transporter (DMT)-like permease
MKSLLALGYLAIAGSLVAYSAYFWLLNRFPPTLIATHTYVNPIVASVLGWSIAGEVLTARFVFGGVVVVAAIALLGRATSREGMATKIREHPHAPATQQKLRQSLPFKISYWLCTKSNF